MSGCIWCDATDRDPAGGGVFPPISFHNQTIDEKQNFISVQPKICHLSSLNIHVNFMPCQYWAVVQIDL